MRKLFRGLPAAILLAALLPAIASADERFEGVLNSLVMVALDPAGVRQMGMASTGAASVYAASPGDINPVTLAWTRGILFDVEHQKRDYGFTVTGYQLMVGTSIDTLIERDGWRYGARLGYRTTEDGTPFTATPAIVPGITPVHDGDDIFTLAAATRYTRGRISAAVGVTARYMTLRDVDLTDTDLTGWDFDFGLLLTATYFYDDALIRPRAGISSRHYDAGLTEHENAPYDVPEETHLGLGVDLALPRREFGGRNVAAITMALDYDAVFQDDDSEGAFGLEWSLMDIVQIRVGLGKDVDTNGAGLGWVFSGWMVRADYAHRDAGSDSEAWSTTVGRMF